MIPLPGTHLASSQAVLPVILMFIVGLKAAQKATLGNIQTPNFHRYLNGGGTGAPVAGGPGVTQKPDALLFCLNEV